MPYKRVGKCVYKKYDNGELGAKVGCSDSVEKAKDYLKALYASEGGDIKEEKDMSTQDYINLYMKNKQQFVNRYGKDAENVIKKRAEKLVKSNKEKSLKELVNKLIKEKLDPVGKEDTDVNNDGKVDKTDDYLLNRRKSISKNIKEGVEGVSSKDELKTKIRLLATDIVSKKKEKVAKEETFPILYKFPSLKVILNNLFDSQLEPFIKSINWVAPNPTTFRIDLKNGEYFFLTYTGKADGKDLYVAKIAGKKYYLESLMDQERATDALSRLLIQGNFEEVPEDEEAPTEEEVSVEDEETPAEETPAEEEGGEEVPAEA
jgi:hypothetical protein